MDWPLLYQSLLIDMVEARGVEPLSETVSTRASTGVSDKLRQPWNAPVPFPSLPSLSADSAVQYPFSSGSAQGYH